MQVIPAIDVSSGHLARLDSGGRISVDAFEADPLKAARSFIEAGALMLHLVDMDRAFDGVATALELITEVVALGVRVQASGGISTGEEVSLALDAGAERVVLGSGALRDFDEVAGLVGLFGKRLVVGIETDGGSIDPRGRWGDNASDPIDLDSAVRAVVGMGAARLLLTQVGRVGSKAGMDMAGVRSVMSLAGGVPVLVSGGVATLEVLSALDGMGVEAVVIGRALYEGELDLATTIRALS